MLVLGDQKVADRYKVKITIGKDSSNQLIFVGKVFPVDACRKTIWRDPDVPGFSDRWVNKIKTEYTLENECRYKIEINYDIIKVS